MKLKINAKTRIHKINLQKGEISHGYHYLYFG